jgi:ATP-dependent DNA helicase RecG
MSDQRPLTNIKGVGSALSVLLKRLGLVSVGDLIDYYPRRYDDYSRLTPISKMMPGMVTVQATIANATGRYVRRGMHITEAIASDDTGSVKLVWFNQPYRAAALKAGQSYYIAGEFGLHNSKFSITNPAIEQVSEFPVNAARIIPIYRETKGLTSKQLRKVMRQVVPSMRQLPEQLPGDIVQKHKLVSYAEAIEQIHFPKDSNALAAARRRLAFQEVFELITASLLNKQEVDAEPTFHVPFNVKIAKKFVAELPFTLTDAQRATIWQVYQDLEADKPMNRLVEGDVGSGKTVVAAMAGLMVAHAGMQTAFMAPTELLARQHAHSLYDLLKPLGMEDSVVLLVGSMTQKEKAAARSVIACGKAKFLVGTHALIQESVDMHKLALVVIDEQHRFGVEQRKTLMSKAGAMPHVLSLTATPIPRSLALTVYGELDISIIAFKPKGRQSVQTSIVSPNSRMQMNEKITTELEKGRQMFVVCPFISPNEKTEFSKVRSVEKTYNEIRKTFPEHSVAMLHGKQSAEEKNAIMEQFVTHAIDILVSTTVIEVGVDVPNASIMLVESAERFGLAQVHQLRGRIGRGGHEGFCYLVTSDSQAPSKRLRALESSNDGFRLAELDLELRGPGAIYGRMQHGALDLRIANLSDTKLIAIARQSAKQSVDDHIDLLQYPQLAKRIERLRTITNLN